MTDISELEKTVLHNEHIRLDANMTDFGGWHMPKWYTGMAEEHLATRRAAGLFDVSHMGRFRFSGDGALSFLQYALTNNTLNLDEIGMGQYTFISNENGEAIDDAYLYRTGNKEFMLVVNAGNRKKDWDWLHDLSQEFNNLQMDDISDEYAMLSLQGPKAKDILEKILNDPKYFGKLESRRNRSSIVNIGGTNIQIARTGYTGENVCYEIFVKPSLARFLWNKILEVGEGYGIAPAGLAARDTLRLEAGLTLYGHELGNLTAPNQDGELQEQEPISILAAPKAHIGVSLSPRKGDYIGREALQKQAKELSDRNRWKEKYTVPLEDRELKRIVMPMAVMNDDLTGPGILIPRQGYEVLLREEMDGKVSERLVGYVTSGSRVPAWAFSGNTIRSQPTDEKLTRPIAMAYLDADLFPYEPGSEEVQGFIIRATGRRVRESKALLVNENLRQGVPYTRAVIHPETPPEAPALKTGDYAKLMTDLVHKAVAETHYRQFDTFNLIPSENTPSELVRLLSVMDMMGRYGEHKHDNLMGLDSPDIFYYEGTEFIAEVEQQLNALVAEYLGCDLAETRLISGQQANEAVFSGMVKWLNRGKIRGAEPKRMESVIAHLLGRGGHLSSQYFGALRDTVAIDPDLDRPGVHAFPVLEDDPYMIDVEATKQLILEKNPQLIVFGKSMILNPEPIKEIADFVKSMPSRPVLMYDAAHVLGLIGKQYQDPFDEGIDILTGSTHKTLFGLQRGLAASSMLPGTEYADLWDNITQRGFPGKLSNHHLGTMLGQNAAMLEMMLHGKDYQRQTINNAKALAKALRDEGIQVEGDPSVGYTQTHQVILRVGNGPEASHRLRLNNIITNYQALPDDLGFMDSSGVRMGVQEMTRFGMKEKDMPKLAHFIAEALKGKTVAAEVSRFRKEFIQMQYTIPYDQSQGMVEMLRDAYNPAA